MEQFVMLANVATVYLIIKIVGQAANMLMQISTYFRLQGTMAEFSEMLKEKEQAKRTMGFNHKEKDGE